VGDTSLLHSLCVVLLMVEVDLLSLMSMKVYDSYLFSKPMNNMFNGRIQIPLDLMVRLCTNKLIVKVKIF
jgi:hypothetical protein